MSSFSPGDIVVKTPNPTNPTIYNLTASLAATEYNHVVAAGTLYFKISARGLSTLKLSFTSGQSGTVYVTIPSGSKWCSPNLSGTASLTIYFQTTKSNEVVEVEEWT